MPDQRTAQESRGKIAMIFLHDVMSSLRGIADMFVMLVADHGSISVLIAIRNEFPGLPFCAFVVVMLQTHLNNIPVLHVHVTGNTSLKRMRFLHT